MRSAVFDTNVLVSSLIKTGRPRLLWNHVLAGKIQLVISKQIMDEFYDVGERPRIRRYVTSFNVNEFTQILLHRAKIVEVRGHLPQVTPDPKDNMIVEAAVEGKVKFIVSGDRHLLTLKMFRGIRILTVGEMIDILEKK